MKDLEFFIASIKQFITGTANNLKTILDKKFKGSGLIEVTTETIRDTGDIEVKLKDIPGKSLIGNDATGNASPIAITIDTSLEMSGSNLKVFTPDYNPLTVYNNIVG